MKNLHVLQVAILCCVSQLVNASPLQMGSSAKMDLSSTQYADLFSGAARFSVPIELPMGPGGFTPRLSLEYSSDSGNGKIGLGWSISGLDRIERSTRFGIPSYFDPDPRREQNDSLIFDRFNLYLGGRRYELFYDKKQRKVISDPYGHLNINFTHTEKGISDWIIRDRNGTIFVFKGIPAIRSKGGFRYYPIEKATDSNGNQINYYYSIDKVNGDYYPQRIVYGLRSDHEISNDDINTPPVINDGGIGTHFDEGAKRAVQIIVSFGLESRSIVNSSPPRYDIVADYKGGSRVEIDKRIKTIDISSTTLGHSRRYLLEYSSAKRGGQSLLTAVKIIGAKEQTTAINSCGSAFHGESLTNSPLEFTFEYAGHGQNNVEGFEPKFKNEKPYLWPILSTRGNGGKAFPGVRWIDLNGDALPDMSWGLSNPGTMKVRILHYSNSTNSWYQVASWNKLFVSAQSIATAPMVWSPIWQSLKSTSMPFSDTVFSKTMPAAFSRWIGSFQGVFPGTRFVDVNRDGYLDIMHSFRDYKRGGRFDRVTWINLKGKGWRQDPNWRLPEKLPHPNGSSDFPINLALIDPNANWSNMPNLIMADVNGDKYPDLVHGLGYITDTKRIGTFLNRGRRGLSGWESKPSPEFETPADSFVWSHVSALLPSNLYGAVILPPRSVDFGYRYIDLNGDGLTDILRFGIGWETLKHAAWINTGSVQSNGTVYKQDDRWVVGEVFDEIVVQGEFENQPMGVHVLDINVDGLPDLVFSLKHHSGTHTTKVLFNTHNGWGDLETRSAERLWEPKSWVDDIPPFIVTTQAGGKSPNGVSFADFNADGAIDIGQSLQRYLSSPNTGVFKADQKQVQIWLNKFKKPLLKKAINPYGASRSFNYRSSHENFSFNKHKDGNGANRLPRPKQVVWSVTSDDGVRNQVETRFAFQGGLFDEGEFRGFRTVSVQPVGRGVPTHRRTYTFYQDQARKGKLSSIRFGDARVYREVFHKYRVIERGSDQRGEAFETHLENQYDLDYEKILTSRNLIYDFNFEVELENEDHSLVRDQKLTHLSWPYASQIKMEEGIIATTDKIFRPDPNSPTRVIPETAPEMPFASRGLSGAAFFKFPVNSRHSAVSIHAWVLNGGGDAVLLKIGSAVTLEIRGGGLLAKISGNDTIELRSDDSLKVGEYTHVAVSYDDRSGITMHLNGRLQSGLRKTVGSLRWLRNESLQIGGSQTNIVDEVKIFNSVVNVPRITKATYNYDLQGNISRSLTYGDLSSSEDDFSVVRVYEFNLGKHILGLLTEESVFKGISSNNPNDLIAKTWFKYDLNGNLNNKVKWAGIRDLAGEPDQAHSTNPKENYNHDVWGNVKSVKDPNGHETKFSYSPDYAVSPISITNAKGHVQTLDYYGFGPRQKKLDKYLGTFGKLKRTTLPGGAKERFIYDRYGRIRAIYGPEDGDIDDGHLYPSVFTDYGFINLPNARRKTMRIYIASRSWPLVFNGTMLNMECDLSSLGLSKKESQLISITTSGMFLENYLQAKGVENEIQYLDGNQRIIQQLQEYDIENHSIWVSGLQELDALGRVSAENQPVIIQDPKMFHAAVPGGTGDLLNLVPWLANYYQSPDQQNAKREFKYDAIGRLERSVEPNGALTTYDYNRGRTTVIDPNGHKTVEYYDVQRRLRRIEQFPGKHGEQASWNPGAVIAATDPGKPWLEREMAKVSQPNAGLNSLDRIANTLISLLSSRPTVTRYKYDLLGGLSEVLDEQGNKVLINYDTLGRRKSVNHPDAGEWLYGYDLSGNIVTTKSPKGILIKRIYDELNRLVEKRFLKSVSQPNSRPGALEDETELPEFNIPTVTEISIQNPHRWIYDDVSIGGVNAIGQLVRMEDASGQIEYRDLLPEGEAQKIVRTIDGVNYEARFDYDLLGRLKKLIYPDAEEVSYARNRMGYITRVENQHEQYAQSVNYDALGRVRKLILGNGIEEKYVYADYPRGHQWLSEIVTVGPVFSNTSASDSSEDDADESSDDLLDHEGDRSNLRHKIYDYDAVGNVVSIRDQRDPKNSQTFGYDHLDRLVKETINGKVKSYSYDRIGNLIRSGGLQLNYGVGVGPRTLSSATGVDELGQLVNTTLKYDKNGNVDQLVEPTVTRKLEWGPHSILKSFDSSKYTYDGYGWRVKQESGGLVKVSPFAFYETERPAASPNLTQFEKRRKSYLLGDLQVAMREIKRGTNRLQYQHRDHLTSVEFETDTSAQVVTRVSYSPFGSIRAITNGNRMGEQKFSGKELDKNGAYYFGARYYYPKLKMFLSPDPLALHGQQEQRAGIVELGAYAYAINNPINFVDPLGLQANTPQKDYDCAADPYCEEVRGYRSFLNYLIDSFYDIGHRFNESYAPGWNYLVGSKIRNPTFYYWFDQTFTAFEWASGAVAVKTALRAAKGTQALMMAARGKGPKPPSLRNKGPKGRGVPKRPLTTKDLGLKGTLKELKGTFSVSDDVATVWIDMIDGEIKNSFEIIKNLSNTARSHGAKTLRIEARLANERLYNILVKRYGLISEGSLDVITIPLGK